MTTDREPEVTVELLVKLSDEQITNWRQAVSRAPTEADSDEQLEPK